MELADSITETLDNALEPLHSNPTLFTFVSLFLILYGSLTKPQLPPIMRQLFDNAIFRVIILSSILLRKGNDIQLSLMIAIAYVYTIQLNNMEKTKEKFQSKINYFYK